MTVVIKEVHAEQIAWQIESAAKVDERRKNVAGVLGVEKSNEAKKL